MSTLMKDGFQLEGYRLSLDLCWWALACCRMVVVYWGEGMVVMVADMKLVACKWHPPPLLELQAQASPWKLAWASE